MKYHIEHAKYKYEQITVTGWLIGDTAEAVTSVWVEDGMGERISCQVMRTERDDVRSTFFPQDTQCDFGFRLKFAAENRKTYLLCFGDGTVVRRCKTNTEQVIRLGRIPDGIKEEVRLLLSRNGKQDSEQDRPRSPYLPAETRKEKHQKQERLERLAERMDITFSFVIPAYGTNPEHLADLLTSIQAQTYEKWEICLADGSPVSMKEVYLHPTEHTETLYEMGQGLTEQLAACFADPRMKYIHLTENLGISGNTNAAFALAQGDFVVMVDHDDILTEDALEQILRVVADHPQADFIYSDSDLTDHDDMYPYNPLFKPEWSPEMLYSANYITHLSVVRRSVLEQIGGWQSAYDGAQDWDLFLRIGEVTDQIYRIPQVLYHWRAADGSTARNVEEKPYARMAQLKAVQDHLDRLGIDGKAMFTGKSGTCIRVDWTAGKSDTAGAYRGDVLIKKASGVNVSQETIEELKAWACVPGIGVVCPRVVDGKGRILSQGLLLKEDDVIPLLEGRFPGTANEWGHTDWYRNHVAAEPYCYAVSRQVWDQVGGPDDSLGDLAMIDFCLRAEQAGYRNLMTPFAQVCAEESVAAKIRSGKLNAYKKLYEQRKKK